MQCVNCGRRTGDDDTQCPYCGCPVLSRKSVDADAEQTSDDVFGERRLAKVVPFRPAVPAFPASWVMTEAILWAIPTAALGWALHALASPATWIVWGLCVAADVAVLRAYDARPWLHARAGRALVDDDRRHAA